MVKYIAGSSGSVVSVGCEASLDEVQSKKTALFFLCRINADSNEIERFLTRYPEALLFEGADVDVGARIIIETQTRRCKCFVSVCNANRKRVLSLLRRGFEYYRAVVFQQSMEDDRFFQKISGGRHWEFYSEQLKTLEKDLRENHEKAVRAKKCIMKARAQVTEYRSQLENASRHEQMGRSMSLLKCHRSADAVEKRSMLENELGTATLAILSLEQEHDLLQQERVAAKQLQTALLKTLFAGCERHVCNATRRDIDDEI